MAYPAAHLLSLPRELRDQIYGYLTHDVHFAWDSNVVLDSRNGITFEKYTQITMRVHNAPLLSLLLTHSHIHAETSKFTCFRGSEATIDINLHHGDLPHVGQETEIQRTFRQKAKQGLHKVTVHISNTEMISPWATFRPIYSILDTVPDLKTVYMALHILDCNTHTTSQTHEPPSAPFSRPDRSYDPPLALNDLPLVQRVEGIRLSYWAQHEDHPFRDPMGPYHAYEAAVLLYTNEVADHSWWEKEDIVSNWPLHPIPLRILQDLPLDVVRKLVPLPSKMHRWKEMRGDEVKKW